MKKNSINKKNHKTISLMVSVGLLYLFLIVGLTFWSRSTSEVEKKYFIKHKRIALQSLVEDERIINALKDANEANKNLTIRDYQNLDDAWIHDDGKMCGESLSKKTSLILRDFQREHPSFSEIFITDQYGLIAGLTNKTSDFYQADEEWWQKAYHQGHYLSAVEYDSSAQSWSYSLTLRIHNDDDNSIGILKAVIDLQSIYAKP